MEQRELKLTYRLQVGDQEFDLTRDEVLQIKRLIDAMISEPELPPYNPYPYNPMPQPDWLGPFIRDRVFDPVYGDRFYSSCSVDADPMKDPILGILMNTPRGEC